MKFSSSTASSSDFRASQAYMEKHEVAIFNRAPGLRLCFEIVAEQVADVVD